LITAVEAQGPADGALIIGDVLLKVESTPISFKDLGKFSARLVPDSLATLALMRGGAQLSVAVKVGRLPEPVSNPALTGNQDIWVPALRIGVAETTDTIRKAIHAEQESTGMIVTQLRPAGPGALAGLKVGDLITHIGTKQIFAAPELAGIKPPTPQDPLLLRVVREGSPAFVALPNESAP
jgi:serine protease Do